MKNISINPMYRYLIVLTVASTVGLQTWRTLFNNFAVEIVGLNGAQVGIIQSVREVPGFLALLTVYFILIIKEHHLSALSVLFLGIGVAATGFFPTYGGLIFTTLILVFIGYAVIENKMGIAILYILDHIFFNFAIAIRTYFQKIGAPDDVASSMAVGFTINHISAVALPAIGGLIWMIDYRLVFLAGAAMSLISLLACQMIRIENHPQT